MTNRKIPRLVNEPSTPLSNIKIQGNLNSNRSNVQPLNLVYEPFTPLTHRPSCSL